MDNPTVVDKPRSVEELRSLLLRRAGALGIVAEAQRGSGHPGDGEDAAIEALLEREVVVPKAGEAECRRHYDTHADRFRSGDLVYARHILFAVTPGAPLDLIRRKAEATLFEVVQRPERFAELAAQCSNCPSASQGGALGQLGRGDTVPEFERAVFEGSATGVLPRLVATRHGFHIVSVDRREAGRLLPFEVVHERIAAELERRVLERALAQYLEVIAGSPLVQ